MKQGLITFSPRYPDVNCPGCGCGFDVEWSEMLELSNADPVPGNYSAVCPECAKEFTFTVKIKYSQQDNKRLDWLEIAALFDQEDRSLLCIALSRLEDRVRKTLKKQDGCMTIDEREEAEGKLKRAAKLKERLK